MNERKLLLNCTYVVDLGNKWRNQIATLPELDRLGITPYFKNGRLMWKCERRMSSLGIHVLGRANHPLVARSNADRAFKKALAKLPPPDISCGAKTIDSV